VLLGTLYSAFVTAIMCLSSFLMSGMEYGIAWKLYATPILSTIFTIFIFCFIVLGDASSCLLCFSSLSMVICLWRFHFRDGISWMPKYLYGSF
jgi:hypothetical protein